jgi:hypothetical protein
MSRRRATAGGDARPVRADATGAVKAVPKRLLIFVRYAV